MERNVNSYSRRQKSLFVTVNPLLLLLTYRKMNVNPFRMFGVSFFLQGSLHMQLSDFAETWKAEGGDSLSYFLFFVYNLCASVHSAYSLWKRKQALILASYSYYNDLFAFCLFLKISFWNKHKKKWSQNNLFSAINLKTILSETMYLATYFSRFLSTYMHLSTSMYGV